MPTYHLTISGKVQGVFYRASAKQIASKTGITGWIKNTKEGNVEAMVSGTEDQLQPFLAWCKQGPSGARVLNVQIMPEQETHFNDFSIKKELSS